VTWQAAAATALAAARARTLALLDPLTDAEQTAQHSELMSPLVWDLAHVGNYEELWLVRAITGAPTTSSQLDDMYNAFEHPRWERPSLPLLDPAAARRYIGGVRERALDALAAVDESDSRRLLRSGYVYGMVVQHEHQHAETMLATMQLGGLYPESVARPSPSPLDLPATDIVVDAGPFHMGCTDLSVHPYDNELPAREVHVDGFAIDARPVTNADYAAFVAGGGYAIPALWEPAGWKRRQQAGVCAPLFWIPDGAGGWGVNRFGAVEDLDPAEPVQHVSWYEADAFARFAGKRLPTEAEWEKASPCLFGIGEVWEWTSTTFAAYPGFEAFPYREYSEVFFPSHTQTLYKVLRGGSWATHPAVSRPTFRNWDLPIRRQIFAGFRCARDL
jgi:iron(II)-dependent oxidoreductase